MPPIATSNQKSDGAVLVRLGTTVEGGWLPGPWAVPTHLIKAVEGREFLLLSKTDPELRKLLGLECRKNPWMSNGALDAVATARSAAVDAWYAKKAAEEDPMCIGCAVTWAYRRRLRPEVPDVLRIVVPGSGKCAAHIMLVLTPRSKNERIAMELTGEHMVALARAVRMGEYAPRGSVEHMEPLHRGADGNRRGNIRSHMSRKRLWTTYKSGGGTNTEEGVVVL